MWNVKNRPDAVRIAFVGLAYFLAHQLAFLFPDTHAVVAAVWPAGGIGLGALLLNPRRRWPAILLALFCVGIAASLIQGRPFAASVGFMTANAIESLACASLISLWCGVSVRFSCVREALALIVSATAVNAGTSFIGAGTASMTSGSPFRDTWLTWWVADGLGILLVTPLIVTWSAVGDLFEEPRWRRVFEAGLLLVALSVAAWMSVQPTDVVHPLSVRPYMVIVFIAWAGLRFGQRAVTLALVVLAAISVTSRAVVVGPLLWGGGTYGERLLAVQVFIAFIASTGLLLAAAYTEAKSAEARARALGDHIPSGMVYQGIRDHDGSMRFLYLSAGVKQLTGLSPDEVFRNPSALYSLVLEEDRLALTSAERVSAKDLSACDSVVRLRRLDGEVRWMHLRSTPRLLPDGRTLWDGIQTDITEGKRAEDALREGKERYQSLIECLGEGIVSVSAQRRILMANPAAEKVFGVTCGGAIGRDISGFVDPRDIPLLASEAARRESGETSTFELQAIRPDGEIRAVQVTATPQYHADGRFQGSLAVLRDITEEKALLQRTRLLAHTLESIDECVSICDPDDRLLFVNRAFLRTYRYEECNLIGANISIVRSPLNSPEATVGILPGTLAGGWSGELWNRKKDGTDFLVMLNTAAVVDGNGKLEATVGLARDITENKRAEADLTRALKQADSANQAKREFLANMSHEIRTPMNGVIGMTGLLLDTSLTPEQRDYAETVRRSGEALLSIINDVLDFSKIEAGKLAIKSFAFDLRLVMEEVHEILAPKAEEQQLDLILEYPSRLPRHVIADPGRIRQVLMNLVGNAVKFTCTGSILTAVDCESRDGQRALLRIRVKDTGPGVPPEKVGSLFQKFSQIDTATTRRYGGTGLGLAISKQLVELMGGSIGVNSPPGEGSTFWFTLPIEIEAHPPAAPVPSVDLRDLRVLIVNDNELSRRVIHDQITSWGMRSEGFGSAVGLIEVLAEAKTHGDRYHFAIVGYRVSGVEGATLAAAIKSHPESRDTAVILLAAAGCSSEIRRLEGNCIDAYLVTPVRQSHLMNSLATSWSRKLGTPFSDGAKTYNVTAERNASAAAKWTGRQVRVLVAEDNVVNQKVAALMLRSPGVRVDFASNGHEAVEMSATVPYDVIFMDCQMPKMDGYEATRKIRGCESGRRVAIIAMTADAMAGARENCLDAGMNDYIAKPVKQSDLLGKLQQWVPAQDHQIHLPE